MLTDMTTTVVTVTAGELHSRKARLLASLGLTEEELRRRVDAGGLVGEEWSVLEAIQSIDYLLDGTLPE